MTLRLCRRGYELGKLLLTKPKMRTSQLTQVHSSEVLRCKTLELNEKDLVIKEKVFITAPKKNKESFTSIVTSFRTETKKVKRSHVEFIYAAMKCMEDYNVNADIECYKALMDVFPKGRMISKNMVQSEFYFFPRHQDCAMDLLDQMEWNGVCPDGEMRELIINIFGKSSHVFKKLCRMLYWMPKFINLNPYKLPVPVPGDVQFLAERALRKMCVDPRTKITRFKAEDLEDSIDKTWVVSAQSPVQQKLLLRHNKEKPIYVEGPSLIWMESISLLYFVLKADAVPRQTVEVNEDDVTGLSLYMFGEPKPKELVAVPETEHEQEDATIFGLCITGTSSKDSALSWIRFLQESNPVLDDLAVLFMLRSAPTALTTMNACPSSEQESTEEAEKTENDSSSTAQQSV